MDGWGHHADLKGVLVESRLANLEQFLDSSSAANESPGILCGMRSGKVSSIRPTLGAYLTANAGNGAGNPSPRRGLQLGIGDLAYPVPECYKILIPIGTAK